jgi:hypothetical protein
MSIYLSDERMLHFAKKIKNAPFLLVLATWDIRSGNWHIARDGINLLVEAFEMRVQSIRLILLILSGNSFFSRRRGLIRALYVHLN